MIELKNVSETLWLPLFAKAIESKRKNGYIIDQKSIEIAEKACKLNPELSKWWKSISKELQGIMIWRNISIDSHVQNFTTAHIPSTIVNIGAGLCTRQNRFNKKSIMWLDFDLPEVKKVWCEFYSESDQHKYFTSSIFETQWINEIKSAKKGPILFIAEGLFMYFSKKQVLTLLQQLATHFPTSEIVFEAYSKFLLMLPQSDVKKTSAKNFPHPWGVKTGKDFEKWDPRFIHIGDNYLMGQSKAIKRMPLSHQLVSSLPMIKKSGKMIHLRFK